MTNVVYQGLVDTVVGAVDGLLGSVRMPQLHSGGMLTFDAQITHPSGGGTISFLIDNLGNIVQQVLGAGGGSPTTSIVGNYQLNMTYTGISQNMQNGLVKKTVSCGVHCKFYEQLNANVASIFSTSIVRLMPWSILYLMQLGRSCKPRWSTRGLPQVQQIQVQFQRQAAVQHHQPRHLRQLEREVERVVGVRWWDSTAFKFGHIFEGWNTA
jgi:hypothetical protein